eukprot:GFYU01000410.1.p1 GENE.GFYU01000410.1~~GFYU01000410.1.p1  ORF type:complete len:194 (-),score=37.60 GFYU01000410.1:98-679(-)
MALVHRSKHEDFKDFDEMKFFYATSNDRDGTPTFVLELSNLPASQVDLDRVLVYMIKLMHEIVVEKSEDYSLVYFHSNAQKENMPHTTWLRQVHGVLPREYKKGLNTLYVVHPSWWLRFYFALMVPFVSWKFYWKIMYIDSVEFLWDYYDKRNFNLPKHVAALDKENEAVAEETRIQLTQNMPGAVYGSASTY